MNQGWICLHRELKDKPIWKLSTPEQKTILITLLMAANHKPNEWEFNGEKFSCESGQLVTSLNSLAELSGKGISIQNVRTALNRFEKLGFLTNVSTKTGRLITIVNWGKYQEQFNADNKGSSKAVTKHHQSNNKDLTPNNNEKQCNNVINNYSVGFESFWKEYPRKKEKAKAYKCFNARLKEGYTEESLIDAAIEYSKECKQRKTEERYIKLGATFLGVNKPFDDYIRKEKSNECEENRRQAADFYREFTS